MGPLPLYGEVIVALGLGGNVLPQLAGREAGPSRVVTTAGDPVATLTAFAAWHQLVRRQVGDSVGERTQETVKEVTYSGRQGGQLHTLQNNKNDKKI